MYSAVLVVFFLFDSTVVNIIAGAIFNFCFAKLLFFCKIKDALFSSLFLSVALTASEFAVISGVSSLNGGNINFYQSSLHMFIILVIISRLVFLVIALSVSFFVQKNPLKRLPLFLFFFPVSSVITLYTLWASASENIPSERINILIIISSICVVISILLTYIFYGKTSAELNRLYEIQNQNDRIASDEAYYKILDMQNK